MRGVSKLVIPFLIVLPFIAILFCVILPRRRALWAHLQCWKTKSRVEPAIAMAEIESEKKVEENGGDVLFWLVMSGPSRALYTIKEDEREGKDAELEIAIDVEDDYGDDEEMGFATACASPEFFTPAVSPDR